MHNEGRSSNGLWSSLLKVDYEPLQVIVVDDGSTDDTAERIALSRWPTITNAASRP